MDIETGKVLWQEYMGLGSLIMAGNHLVLVTERRQITVAEVNAIAYRELGSMNVPKGLIWTPPVLANGRLYIRSLTGELYCLELNV